MGQSLTKGSGKLVKKSSSEIIVIIPDSTTASISGNFRDGVEFSWVIFLHSCKEHYHSHFIHSVFVFLHHRFPGIKSLGDCYFTFHYYCHNSISSKLFKAESFISLRDYPIKVNILWRETYIRFWTVQRDSIESFTNRWDLQHRFKCSSDMVLT